MKATNGSSARSRKPGPRPATETTDPQTPPTGPRDAIMSVGAELRTRRLAAGLSLRQFARDLGVSPSFISQMENGKSQPSVATLYMICSALDVSIDELFSKAGVTAPDGDGASPVAAPESADEPATHSFRGALAKLDELPRQQSTPVVTPEQRRRLVLDSGVTWERLSATHEAAVDFLFVRYDVGGSSVSDEQLTRHSGIEYGYVISGTLEVSLGFETYVVTAGQSVSFDSATPHRLTNHGDVPVEAIWFVHGRNSSHEH